MIHHADLGLEHSRFDDGNWVLMIFTGIAQTTIEESDEEDEE